MLNQNTTCENDYDVVIIGAGPAGCECARDVAQTNRKVLLVEKAESFSTQNYSSGGAPIEIMEDFSLPGELVGSYWHKIAIYTTNNKHTWKSQKTGGVILDFMKLRTWLASEAKSHGCDLSLHTAYIGYEHQGAKTIVHLKNLSKNRHYAVSAKVLVDATGVERKVLAGSQYNYDKAMVATGIEYLLETSGETYQKFADTLSFFVGLKWMPQGYAWIFPMQPNLLKAGVIRYFPNENWAPRKSSYNFYLNRLIEEQIGSNNFKTIDRHGKTLTYTYAQKDTLFDANVIAIGDSISSLNPLACEGIRHAMTCGRTATKHILHTLSRNVFDFTPYEKDIRSYFGYKWTASETLMKKFYRHSKDENIDIFFEAVKKLSFDQLTDVAFHYRPTGALKFYVAYNAAMAKKKIKQIFSESY